VRCFENNECAMDYWTSAEAHACPRDAFVYRVLTVNSYVSFGLAAVSVLSVAVVDIHSDDDDDLDLEKKGIAVDLLLLLPPPPPKNAANSRSDDGNRRRCSRL